MWAAGHASGDVTRGLEAVVRVMQEKAPNAVMVLTGIFPRNDKWRRWRPSIRSMRIWRRWRMGSGCGILNVNDRLADRDGKLFEGMMGDQVASDGEGVSGLGGCA